VSLRHFRLTALILLPGSPALDAGDNADAPATDQRGFARIVAGRIDIGAFEVQPGPLATFFLFVAPAQAGRPADVWVLALDAYGHLATGYTGTVAFASFTDPAAQLPAPVTFSPGGFAYVPGGVTFAAPGVYDLWAFDVTGFQYGVTLVVVA